MTIQTLRRFSVSWLFLAVWLAGVGCNPASPLSDEATGDPAAGPGGGDAGTATDAAVDRILVTAGTGGCGGSASCAGVGTAADAGSSGASASDGAAPPDGGATDPRASDAAPASDGGVGACGAGGRAGSGGAAVSSPTGSGGMAGAAAGPGGAAGGVAGRGGTAGSGSTATGGSSAAGGGGGGLAGNAGSAGRAENGGGASGGGAGGASGGAGPPGTSGLAPAPGDLRIVELLVNPAGTDTGREWIEIANVSSHALDLASVHVADAANDAALDFAALAGASPTLPAGGRAVLIQSADASKNGGVTLAAGGSGILGGAFGTRVSLNNDTDTITLCAGPCRAGGVTLDEVTWTDLGADYDGHALSIDGTGRRCPAADPFGDAGSFGTPGASNPTCP